jgi:hypothetical protein
MVRQTINNNCVSYTFDCFYKHVRTTQKIENPRAYLFLHCVRVYFNCISAVCKTKLNSKRYLTRGGPSIIPVH